MSLATREAFRAFSRAPMLSALSITTIAFSLFAFGLFGLVALNLRAALRQVEDRVEIRGFVAEGTPPEAPSAAAGDIGLFPEVESVRLITATQALERARRELVEFDDVLEDGILPPSIEIRLKPGLRDPTTVRTIAKRLEQYDFIDDVRYGEEWVEKLYRLRNIASSVGITLGVTFALVAVIIIGSTIRMAVLARAREIHIMRLVGATDSFIRRPFLIEGLLKGAMGGVLALVLTYVAYSMVARFVLQAQFFTPEIALAGIAAGAMLGLLGSAFSVGRHLRGV